ncbi:interferon beta [Molossus nigricans]
MTNGCTLQMALLLWLPIAALSTNYNLLQFQQKRGNANCSELLRELEGAPEHCMESSMDFKVPEKIKQPQQIQKVEAVVVIHEMLLQIFDIFKANFSSTGWNETTVAKLRTQLNFQMDRLKEALMEIIKEGNFTPGNLTQMQLRSYYYRMRQYLRDKMYSRCAWTVVRVELLRNFSFLQRYTVFLQN